VTARSLALAFTLLGLGSILRAENPPEIEDDDHSPYHLALLDYKEGKYQEARVAIDAADKAKPGDPVIEILKARILIELLQFDEANKVLRSFFGKPGITAAMGDAIEDALGDLNLRKRSFDTAAKIYERRLAAKPNDPDLTLKLIYAEIGSGDLVDAGKIASQLTPLDPKNPYDDHASYYFAKAALAQATGKSQEAEDEIQSARTNYGITVTNRYLKTYLEVFAPPEKPPTSGATAPTGAN
jgi:tetratricopeptide (TPR) repeat protein